MKKILLWLSVLLLAGCAVYTEAPTEGNMKSYLKYLSTSNSDYRGVYENSGSADGYSYGYVGNNSSAAGFWLLFKFPADFPYEDTLIGGYEAKAADVSAATLRIMEVNKGTRGSSALNLKISPITGAWNPSCNWTNKPAYNASIVKTYSSFGAIPSKSNYNTRTGYHAAQYKYNKYDLSGHPLGYEYFSTYKGEQFTIWTTPAATYRYDSTISAYYDYYYKYHTIDIKDVIKYCIENHATGLLLYFDTSITAYNRKVFTTVEETADSRRPAISITFDEGSGSYINMKGMQDGEFKQIAGMKGIQGGQWVNIGGMKAVKVVDGVKTWVDIMG